MDDTGILEKFVYSLTKLSVFIQLCLALEGLLLSNLEDEEFCDSSERGEVDEMAGIKKLEKISPKLFLVFLVCYISLLPAILFPC